MVREVRNLRDALDTTSEISKLLKYWPKRDRMFEKLKAELAPETAPGFRVFCPTRWTVRAASLQSVIDNWILLQELWDESLETNLKSEVKSRVIGVKHQMGTFDYYFGVSLGAQILRISDNLSKTLQDAHISASEGHAVSSLTVKTLEKMRSDDHFNLFWETVTHKANALEVSEPSLPRHRKRPARYVSGSATPEFVDNAQDYFRQIYLNAIDTVTACIKRRFDQPGYKIYDQMEQMLVNAANGKPFEKNLDDVVDFYKDNLDKFQLETQLSLLSVHFGRENGKVSLEDIIKYLRNLTNAQTMFM